MPLKIFISYAKEDRERAVRCYDLFAQEGADPWMDFKRILPGQNWEAEIERAFSDANVVVLLLSKCSVNKRGFVQREANDAIERLRYKQPTDIYVIPLLLEPCEVPVAIAGRLQYVDLGAPGAWEQVCSALRLASAQQSIELAEGQRIGPFNLFTEKLSERWKGCPGHDIDIEYPRFESVTQPQFAKELSAIFLGRAYETLLRARKKPWDQSPELFADGDESVGSDGRWDGFGVVTATDRLLSLTYDVGWYGAGAAHPNSYFETHNFLFLDRMYRLELADFFVDATQAARLISKICVRELAREYWERTGEKPGSSELDWFNQGAGPDIDNFEAFTISAGHFTFLFAPYQVSSYAMGRWSVDVSFYDLLESLKADGPYRGLSPLA